MVKTVNKRRRDVQFKVGDEVVIRTSFLPQQAFAQIPPKIRRRFIGPFRIEKIISPVAYRVALPATWRVHPTFHVEKLKLFERSSEFQRNVDPPPPLKIEGHLEYEVEAIIRHKGAGVRKHYLVAWKGLPLHEATWEPESNLAHCSDLLSEYLQRQQANAQKNTQSRRKSTRRK